MLVLPQTPNQVHPVLKQMSILVFHLSGSLQKGNNCQVMILKYYQLRGEWEHGKSSILISKCLSSFPVKGTLIPFKQPLRWK